MQSNKAIRFNFLSTSGYGSHFEFFDFNRFLFFFLVFKKCLVKSLDIRVRKSILLKNFIK